MADARDDFYVGYLPQAPAELARVTRRRVGVVLALTLAVAGLLTATQRPVSSAVFEFGVDRPFEGWIVERPYPQLVVERPGHEAGVSRWLLTVFGKRGAKAAVLGLDGEHVRLVGQLVYQGDRTMLEILPDSIEVIPGRSSPRASADDGAWREDLGLQTLRGEIVDSKCFLGVMKPGHLKPHRGCATRCIAGGVPPVLVIRDVEGLAKYVLLASTDGGPLNEAVLDVIAEPVEVAGRLMRLDDLLVLFADPEDVRRVE